MKSRIQASYWLRAMRRQLKPEDLPTEIEYLRNHLRISRRELANVLGVTQSAVSAWERGEYAPSSEILLGLGNLSSPREALYFWSLAGIDAARVLSAVGALFKDRNVPPTKKQLSRIPELQVSPEITIDTAARILRVPEGTVLKLIASGEIKSRAPMAGGFHLLDFGSVLDFAGKTGGERSPRVQRHPKGRK